MKTRVAVVASAFAVFMSALMLLTVVPVAATHTQVNMGTTQFWRECTWWGQCYGHMSWSVDAPRYLDGFGDRSLPQYNGQMVKFGVSYSLNADGWADLIYIDIIVQHRSGPGPDWIDGVSYSTGGAASGVLWFPWHWTYFGDRFEFSYSMQYYDYGQLKQLAFFSGHIVMEDGDPYKDGTDRLNTYHYVVPL